MSFTVVLCVSCFALCTGGALASIVCEVSAKILNRRYVKSRFSITCVLLCISIASASALLIFVPDFFMVFPLGFSDIAFFVFLFFLGFLCSAFWKVVLPVTVFLYIVLSFFTGVRLYRLFGTPAETHDVAVTEGAVRVDDRTFSVSPDVQNSVVLVVYTLPNKLLLPLPRVWYTVEGVLPSSKKKFYSPQNLLPAEFSPDDGSGGFFKKLFYKYDSYIFSDYDCVFTSIPQQTLLPSLYTMTCHAFAGRLFCTVKRSL